MSDYSKLMADLEVLSAKLEVMLTPVPPPPQVDEQPQVDAAAAMVEAMLAKFPA